MRSNFLVQPEIEPWMVGPGRSLPFRTNSVPTHALGLAQRGVRTPDQVCVGVPRVVIGGAVRDGDLPDRFTHRVNGRTHFGPIWLTQLQPARLRVGRSSDARQRWLGKGNGIWSLGLKRTFRRRPNPDAGSAGGASLERTFVGPAATSLRGENLHS